MITQSNLNKQYANGVKICILFLFSFFANQKVHAEIIFQEDFRSKPEASKNFPDTNSFSIVTESQRSAAKFSIINSTNSAYAIFQLDTQLIRGTTLRVSAHAKAANLSSKGMPYHGVKVMITRKYPDSSSQNPQLAWPDNTGSFGWIKSSMIVKIPNNIVRSFLVIGLEQVSGDVYLDSIQIEILGRTNPPPKREAHLPIPKLFSTRLRGAMSKVPLNNESISLFSNKLKGNVIRWKLNGYDTLDSALIHPDYNSFLDMELARLDSSLPKLQASNIKVIIDLHRLSTGLFLNKEAQSRIISTWRLIASRYKSSPVIAGYDIANEPDDFNWSETALMWNELADTICRAIRSVDPETPIIVETLGGSIRSFNQLRPVGCDRNWDLKNIIYSFHFYGPLDLTHQGIPGFAPIGAIYPGYIGGIYYDSSYIHSLFSIAKEFQEKYRVPIYVGEFSCVRWAPQRSAYKWIRDVISITEYYGWDWTYHAFREADAWNAEMSDSINDSKYYPTTDRLELLIEAFKKNRNPYVTPIGAPQVNKSLYYTSGSTYISHTSDGRLTAQGIPSDGKIDLYNINGNFCGVLRNNIEEKTQCRGVVIGKKRSLSHQYTWHPEIQIR